MTIQPISSYNPYAGGSNSTQKPPAQPSSQNQPQDSVQLSAQAKAALGDVDHDGDSH
jgi:hypothetical protein